MLNLIYFCDANKMTESVNQLQKMWQPPKSIDVNAKLISLRLVLAKEIDKYIRENSLTQLEASKKMGLTQPRLNDILKGRLDKCTIDRLMKVLISIDKEIDIAVK